jgi:SAM-dependent methyltransferase
MKTLKFDKEPEFADLWDLCLYNLLYNERNYTQEIIDLFKKIKIFKSSKILDSSAGTGFIALHLRKKGYDVNCMDPMEDEIRVFKKKAKKMNVSQQIRKISWLDISKSYKDKKFDFIFCRGNSFIYARGGWNIKQKVSEKNSLKAYKNTLQIFYNQLNEGGYLYLDKFPDNEKPHKDKFGQIQVKENEPEDLIFHTKIIPKKRYREAGVIRKNSDGIEHCVPNITLDLKETETEKMMKEVGFKVEKLKLKSEKHFVVWLARK